MKKYFYLTLVVLFLSFPLMVQARCETCGAVEKLDKVEVLPTQTSETEETLEMESSGYKMEVQNQQKTENQGDEHGIGQQVRQIAQEQNQVQERVNQAIDKIQTRRGHWLRWMIGTNQRAVDTLQTQTDQIDQMISRLRNVQEDASPELEELLDNSIQDLQTQKDDLLDTIQTENQRLSLFGWLINMFR